MTSELNLCRLLPAQETQRLSYETGRVGVIDDLAGSYPFASMAGLIA